VYHLWSAWVWRTKAGKRRLRLFACGCCRLIWRHLPGDDLRDAVAVAASLRNTGALRVVFYSIDLRARFSEAMALADCAVIDKSKEFIPTSRGSDSPRDT
jgi:hypothetical protein